MNPPSIRRGLLIRCGIGLRVIPFILPEEIERMKSHGRITDPKSIPYTLVVAGNLEPVHRTLVQLGISSSAAAC